MSSIHSAEGERAAPWVSAERKKEEAVLDSLPREVPAFATPMECLEAETLADFPADKSHWLHELKWDGYRCLLVKRNGRAQMFTRGGNRPNVRHEHIVKALTCSGVPDCVLDGELIAFDERGLPKFQLLQQSGKNDAPVAFIAFDLLNLSGRNLKLLSLEERKSFLGHLRHRLPAEISVSDVLEDEVSQLTPALDRMGLEGLIAKRRDSIYRPGSRTSEWVKYKFYEVGEFVIGGYMPRLERSIHGYRDAKYFDALILGEYVEGKLIYKEKLRFGYQPGDKKRIFELIEKLRIPKCPFSNLPQPLRRGALDARQMPECIWVEPRIWCEAAYRERTDSGEIREHAKFRRLLTTLQSM